MTVPKIHIAETPVGPQVRLRDKEKIHYLLSVMRLREQDELTVLDGHGGHYPARIDRIEEEQVLLQLLGHYPPSPTGLTITLAQALVKAQKMDFIIEKGAELGVQTFVPFSADRSIPQLSGDRVATKRLRWQRVAVEAARKTGRSDLPEVLAALPFAQMLARATPEDLKLLAWEQESRQCLRNTLRAAVQARVSCVFAVIGPEGGFTEREIERAVGAGFQTVTLGRRAYKVETAALMLLSILHYEWDSSGETLAYEEN